MRKVCLQHFPTGAGSVGGVFASFLQVQIVREVCFQHLPSASVLLDRNFSLLHGCCGFL